MSYVSSDVPATGFEVIVGVVSVMEGDVLWLQVGDIGVRRAVTSFQVSLRWPC